MAEPGAIKFVRLRHDSYCASCSGRMLIGNPAYWTPNGKVWHLGCPAPDTTDSRTEQEEDAALERWMDRKIEVEAERRKDGVPSGNGLAGINPAAHPTPATVHVSLTSDPRHDNSF